VVFDGRVPKMRPIQVSADPGCAKMHDVNNPLLTEFLVAGENNTIANVIVRVTKGLPADAEYSVPEDPVEVTQHGCQYSPHVFVIRLGQAVRFSNPDGMQHNVHPLPKENREVNRAMSATEKEFTHTFLKAETPFRIKCDVHAWMEAYCAVLDHPFFAVTGTDGAFKIDDLPPGEYEIEAWHEVLGTRTATVNVADGEPAVVDFTFTRPKKKP
jgi:plastocyanin